MANTYERLRTILEDIAKKEDYNLNNIDIKPIISEGANFTADLYLATISKSLKPDIKIFAKVSNMSEEARKYNPYITKANDIEAMFYSEMAKHFEKIYNKYQVPVEDRLNISKYYGHVLDSYEEVLLLENLTTIGFGSFDRMKTFNWDYASTAVTQIAKFHALGLSFRKEFPEEFQNIYKNLDADFGKDNKMVEQIIQTSIKSGIGTLTDHDLKQRVLNFLSSKYDMTNMANLFFVGDKVMLVHGDLKPSNLMHRRRRNGQLDVIILDYQTLRIGNPVVDLLYFVFSGSDQEFRALHYQRLLEHYFTQLTFALRQLDVDVEDVYSRKTFEADLMEWRPMGLVFGLMLTPIVTIAPGDALKLDGDLTNMEIKPSQLAQERINGIVNDYIKWGVL